MPEGAAWSAHAPAWNTVFTILVVDADMPFDGVLDEFIRTRGNFVLRARNYREALDKARIFQPHVILLNGDLEDSGALPVLTDILRADCAAGVLLMTRRPALAEAVEAMRLGALDYVGIPPDPERLTLAITGQMRALSVR